MTYRKYTGRGLGWAKKPLRKRQARRIARFRAGMIILSAIKNGYRPDDMIRRFGHEGTDAVIAELSDIADWLTDTGHPDGESTR